ncbi:hypothetical protein K3495_g14609 [Podosphaera aphanis]|nr:hypothetical protein K3495_g14609 [Podosphaera aphanis]
MAPTRSLATESVSGGKKIKDRLTLAFTVNATGSEKLDMWVIGSSKSPRCFKNINLKHLNIQYRHNKSKWMTGIIMKEYLEWLDDGMKYRKILLLLDNFAGQELAVRLVGGLEGLQNVRVAWLPANTKSHWQPLDQRIIASFKLAYRKQWINFILNQHESGKDPQKTLNILRAIQWSQISWEDLEACVIQRCWWKSTLISRPDRQELEPGFYTTQSEELEAQIAGFFRDPIPIRDFLEPAEEIIVEKDSDIFEAIVKRYSIINGDGDGDDNDGHEEFEEIRPSISEASKAMDTLQSFIFLGKNGGKIPVFKALNQIGNEISQEGRDRFT